MTNRQIANARLRNSGLVDHRFTTPEEVVRWFGAVQSQDVPGALWGIAQRMSGEPTVGPVGAAMDEGRIVRTHALRPTWHFLVPSELRWIQGLTGGRVHQANGSLYRRLGLGETEFARADAAIRDALRGGNALTREELRAAVGTTGIAIDDVLVITYLVMHAELEAIIVSGPRRGKQATYMLVDERIRPASARDRADALRELTLRYFRSHGPALVHDMAWWSGLTVGQVREGVELAGDALDRRRVDGKDYVAASDSWNDEPSPRPHVLLLPNYDEAVASYRDYSPVIDDAFSRPRSASDVLGAHIVVRDGLVIGGWRRALSPTKVTVTATLLVPLTPADTTAVESAAAAFGRFLGLAVDLRIVEPSRR